LTRAERTAAPSASTFSTTLQRLRDVVRERLVVLRDREVVRRPCEAAPPLRPIALMCPGLRLIVLPPLRPACLLLIAMTHLLLLSPGFLRPIENVSTGSQFFLRFTRTRRRSETATRRRCCKAGADTPQHTRAIAPRVRVTGKSAAPAYDGGARVRKA
jgi:hypothetical protein